MKKKYYQTTQKQKQKDRVRRLWLRNREVILAAKDAPCVDCGIKYPPHVMDLDHVRGKKEFNLGPSGCRSVARIKAEIEKCDLVCANCHRERTHQRKMRS